MPNSFQTIDPRYFAPIVVTSKPITDDWRRWIAESKFSGADENLIIQELVRYGISPSAARLEISAIVQNPYFQVGLNFVHKLKKIESHASI